MPDEKRIKDFEPATNLLIDDWFAVDSPSQGTRKIQKSMFMADEIASLETLSTAMGIAQTDIGNLQTRAGMSQSLNFGDNLTDGVNILSVLLGAEPYVNTRTYAVGEYCVYEKQLYKCTTAVTSAEDFDSDKWTLTNVKTELTELNSSLAISAGTITPSSGVTVQAYTFVKIGHICVLSFALRCPNISSGGTIATLPYSSAVATFNTVQDNDNIINYLKVEGNKLITDIAKSSSQIGLVIGEIVYITRS